MDIEIGVNQRLYLQQITARSPPLLSSICKNPTTLAMDERGKKKSRNGYQVRSGHGRLLLH